jgi:hypothetical protein
MTDDAVLEALKALDDVEHLARVARREWDRRHDGDGQVRALGQVDE